MGVWANLPTSYAYPWELCDKSGGSCKTIGGAVSANYPVTASEAGASLRVSVTATNGSGTSVPVESPSVLVTG